MTTMRVVPMARNEFGVVSRYFPEFPEELQRRLK